MNRADYVRLAKERRWKRVAKEKAEAWFAYIDELRATPQPTMNEVRQSLGMPTIEENNDQR